MYRAIGALLRGPSGGGQVERELAFDHASLLGREMRDDRRRLLLSQGEVEKYALKGHGGTYREGADAKGENSLLLALMAVAAYPNYFPPWLAQVRELNPADFDDIVERIPTTWMSTEAKAFSLKLIATTTGKHKTIPS